MSIKDNRNFRFETKRFIQVRKILIPQQTQGQFLYIRQHHMCSEILNMLPQDLV